MKMKVYSARCFLSMIFVPCALNAELVRFCKMTEAGREFAGNVGVTRNGLTCQRWDAQIPHRHNYTDDNMFPDESASRAGARCRNPNKDFNDGPWCYTMNVNVTWEMCDIRDCAAVDQVSSTCKLTKGGHEYRGNETHTGGGQQCQSWALKKPHDHPYTKNYMFSEGRSTLTGARCRNPELANGKGPWCYTTDVSVRWGWCNVPRCTGIDANYCPPGFHYAGRSSGQCYKVILRVLSRAEANENCNKEASGAHLAMLLNSKHGEAVVRVVNNERTINPDAIITQCQVEQPKENRTADEGNSDDYEDCTTDSPANPPGWSAYHIGQSHTSLTNASTKVKKIGLPSLYFHSNENVIWQDTANLKVGCSICEVKPKFA